MTAFTGSCTCGVVKFVVCLELPPENSPDPKPDDGPRPLEIYKCNCTRCHKFGFFHIRPLNPYQDFFLLSPLDPFSELGDFQPKKHWFFCKTCGGRPFVFDGEGETVEIDFSTMGTNVAHLGTQRVWKVKTWKYLSVNALLVDAHQDGFDLREWTKKKWIRYVNALDSPYRIRQEEPQTGGQY